MSTKKKVSKPCNTISSNKFQIEKNRAFDKNIEKLVNDRQQMFSEELKINFFTDTDSKARMNRLKRNVNEIMNQRNFLISDRRAKFVLKKNFNPKLKYIILPD